MGSVIMIFVIMFIVAGFAFAPLGYFIYKFSQEDAKPFGDTEPHGDSESWVLNLAETVIHKIKGIIFKS